MFLTLIIIQGFAGCAKCKVRVNVAHCIMVKGGWGANPQTKAVKCSLIWIIMPVKGCTGYQYLRFS